MRLPGRLLSAAVLILLTITLCGCPGRVAARNIIAHKMRCDDVDVTHVGNHVFVGQGCGLTREYVCKNFHCRPHVAEAAMPSESETLSYERPYTPFDNEGQAAAERSYDDALEAGVVEARFTSQQGNGRVTLRSLPSVDGGAVQVDFGVKGAEGLADCAELEVLINGKPHGASSVSTSKPEYATVVIHGQIPAEPLGVLAQPHAIFGVRACGVTFNAQKDQMPALAEFNGIYEQIAKE